MSRETVVDAWLGEQDELDVERVSERRWFFMLAGEHKRTIPVALELGEHALLVQSFFMRAPDENEADLYGYLLGRNLRSFALRFALTPDGDVVIVGQLPLPAINNDELDRLLGTLLETADEAFDHALRLGFGSYIEREQAWRKSVGAPPNPIT